MTDRADSMPAPAAKHAPSVGDTLSISPKAAPSDHAAPSRPARPLTLLSSFPTPPTHIPASPGGAGSPMYPATPLSASPLFQSSSPSSPLSQTVLASAGPPRLERLDAAASAAHRPARIDTSVAQRGLIHPAGPPPTTPLPPIPSAGLPSPFVAGPPPTAPLPPLPDAPSPVTQEARGEAQRAFLMRRVSSGGASVHSVHSVASAASVSSKSMFAARTGARRTRMRSGSTSTSTSTLASVLTTSSGNQHATSGRTSDVRSEGAETGAERGAVAPQVEVEDDGGQVIELPSRTTSPSDSMSTPKVATYPSEVHSDSPDDRALLHAATLSPSNSVSSQKSATTTSSRVSPDSNSAFPARAARRPAHKHQDADLDRDGASSPDVVSLIQRTQSNTPRARSRSHSRRQRSRSLHSSTHGYSARSPALAKSTGLPSPTTAIGSYSTGSAPSARYSTAAAMRAEGHNLKRLRSTPALSLAQSSVYPHGRPAGQAWDEVWRARGEGQAEARGPGREQQGRGRTGRKAAVPDARMGAAGVAMDGAEGSDAASVLDRDDAERDLDVMGSEDGDGAGGLYDTETDIENEQEIGQEIDEDSEEDVIDLRTPLP